MNEYHVRCSAMKPLERLFRDYARSHPVDAARAIEELPVDEAAGLLVKYRAEVVGPVFERLAPVFAGDVLAHLGPDRSRRLLRRMHPGQAAALLRHLEPTAREEVLKGLDPSEAEPLLALLKHASDTAGGMMDSRLTTIPSDTTVEKAVRIIRTAKQQTLHYLYVTDREGKLLGVVGTREVLLAQSKDPIEIDCQHGRCRVLGRRDSACTQRHAQRSGAVLVDLPHDRDRCRWIREFPGVRRAVRFLACLISEGWAARWRTARPLAPSGASEQVPETLSIGGTRRSMQGSRKPINTHGVLR
jgi:magnesium transporter